MTDCATDLLENVRSRRGPRKRGIRWSRPSPQTMNPESFPWISGPAPSNHSSFPATLSSSFPTTLDSLLALLDWTSASSSISPLSLSPSPLYLPPSLFPPPPSLPFSLSPSFPSLPPSLYLPLFLSPPSLCPPRSYAVCNFILIASPATPASIVSH